MSLFSATRVVRLNREQANEKRGEEKEMNSKPENVLPLSNISSPRISPMHNSILFRYEVEN